jgi:hypothetical protein
MGERPAAPVGALAGALAVLAVLAVLAGCASIPSAGPVDAGREITFRQQDAYIRRLAQPPRRGASREAIAKGFLVAAGDFDHDHAIAREYLAPGLRRSWGGEQGVRIYNEATLRLRPRPNNELAVMAELVGTIAEDGTYTRAPGGARLKSSMRLGQVDGEWRVVRLEPGLLLTNGDVARAYRETNLYFAEVATGKRLVPDPVLLPIKQGLATTVVQALLRGPTARMRGALASQFPAGTRLAGRSVPVENGVVNVDLSGEARNAVGHQRELLSAQLVWTLRALPDIRAVRITVDGADYAVPGVPDQQPRDAWQDYAPDVIRPGAQLYMLAARRLVAFSPPGGSQAGTAVPLAGLVGSGRLELVAPAVSIGGERIAWLSADRRTLYRGSTTTDESPIQVVKGTNLSEPSWDVGGGLWVVDRTSTGPVVHLLTGTVDTRAEAPGLAATRVLSFRIARDGARAAVVVDDGAGRRRLLVGRVERASGPPRVAGLQRVGGELAKLGQVVWQDADHIVAIGRKNDGSAAQPYVVDIDGRAAEATAPLAGITSIAAAPGERLFATAARGRVWQFDGGVWRRVGNGTALAFQG